MNGWPKEKRDAYIAARTAGEWKRSPFTNIPFDSYVYREVLTKGEAEEIAEREEIEPELVDWSVLGEVDRCAVRIARVKAKIVREREALAAAKGDEAARQRVTQAGVNLKALDEELVWLRHQRSLAKADGGTGGGWFEEIRALLKEEDPERRKAEAENSEILKAALLVIEEIKAREKSREDAEKIKPGKRSKFASEIERKEAAEAYRKAYYKARKEGTWIPKKLLGTGQRVVLRDGETVKKTCAPFQPDRGTTADDVAKAAKELNRQRAVRKAKGEELDAAAEQAELQRLTEAFSERRQIVECATAMAKRLDRAHALKVRKENENLRKERKARQEALLEQYGFPVWREDSVDPNNPEQVAARKEYLRQKEAEYRKRNHAHITDYNREYRRRKRAEALAEQQKTWTAEEWAAWRVKEERKLKRTAGGLVKEVVKILAEDGKSDEESIMSRLMECGGVDFLVAGAAGFPKDCGAWLPRAAARAVAFMMDPEDAVMFPTEPWLRKRKSS